MKLEMNRAWSDALAMVGANREVMLIVAGVFFFLPTLAAVLLVPEMQPPGDVSAENAQQVLAEFYARNAPVFVLIGLVQTAGFLTLIALLTDTGKPTVGEAIRQGLAGMLPYIGTQLIIALGAVLLVMLVAGLIVGAGQAAAGALVAAVLAPVAIYVLIKLSLIPPVIAIEKIRNPLEIIRRSWALTRGNSLRLLAFYLLLVVAYFVLSLVLGLVLAPINLLLGEGTGSLLATGLVSGAAGAVAMMIFAAVIAAVHRQLAGPSGGNLAQTFE